MTIKACIIIPAANDSVHDSTFRMNQLNREQLQTFLQTITCIYI